MSPSASSTGILAWGILPPNSFQNSVSSPPTSDVGKQKEEKEKELSERSIPHHPCIFLPFVSFLLPMLMTMESGLSLSRSAFASASAAPLDVLDAVLSAHIYLYCQLSFITFPHLIPSLIFSSLPFPSLPFASLHATIFCYRCFGYIVCHVFQCQGDTRRRAQWRC